MKGYCDKCGKYTKNGIERYDDSLFCEECYKEIFGDLGGKDEN